MFSFSGHVGRIMRSHLCQRHFTGNGYGYDGPWRHDFQQRNATKEAIFICYEWINGRERVPAFRDAIYAFLDLYGEDVKPACRKLWAASLSRIQENEARKLYYFDQGMEELTRILRRRL